MTRRWVDEKRVKWGEGSLLWQVRVLGEFASQGDDAVCPLVDVETAQARELETGEPVVVACDVARFGSDETVIAVRHGPRVRIERAYSGRDTMTTVGEVLRVARGIKPRPVLVVDDVGVGGAVTDRLREVGGFQVVAFNGGHQAHAAVEYPNRRSEAWFSFAELLPELDLDADEQLAADLLAPRYSIDSAGRRVVEAKEQTKRRLGRSPDRADAVLMAFAVNERTGHGSVEFVGKASDPLARRRARSAAAVNNEPGFPGYDSPL